MSTGEFDEAAAGDGGESADSADSVEGKAPSAPPRVGTNSYEAAFLWALAEHGGSDDLLDGLEAGPARDIRDHVRNIESMGAQERVDAAEAWERQDRRADDPGRRMAEWSDEKTDEFLLEMPDAWAYLTRSWKSGGQAFPWLASDEMRAGLAGLVEQTVDEHDHGLRRELLSEEPYSFDALLEMSPAAFMEFVPKFGIYQLAELLRDRNRRRLARVLRRLSDEHRQLLIDCLNRDRDIERPEKIRIREVFVTFSKYYDALPQRVTQLGLYSVACASGYRYRDRIGCLLERLSGKNQRRLERYYRLTYASTRRGVGEHFRRSLEELLAWLDERDESEESSETQRPSDGSGDE